MGDLDLLQKFIQTVEGAKAAGRRPEISGHDLGQLQCVIAYEVQKLRLRLQALVTCKDNAPLLKTAKPAEEFRITVKPIIYPVHHNPSMSEAVFDYNGDNVYITLHAREVSPCFSPLEATSSYDPARTFIFSPVNIFTYMPRVSQVPSSQVHTLIQPITFRIISKVNNCLQCLAEKDQSEITTASSDFADSEIKRIIELIRRLEATIPSMLTGS